MSAQYSPEITPVPTTILNVDDHLMLLKEAVWDARAKWRDIGLKLGLKYGDIQAIHEDDDGDRLGAVLAHWLCNGKATITDLVAALQCKIVNFPDLICNISGLETARPKSLKEMRSALEGRPSMKDFCDLPVEKVWYQLGVWLKISKDYLKELKERTSNEVLRIMFKKFLKTPLGEKYEKFLRFLPWKKRTLVDKFFSDKTYSEQLNTYKDLIAALDNTEAGKVESVFQEVKLLREKLVIALVKVGSRDAAESICHSKGVSLTNYLEATDPVSNPPDCVLRYASYLKSRYKRLSVMPDDWPPSMSKCKNYTNLAIIETGNHTSLTSTMKYDYIHGKIDNIIASKTRIDLDEVFLPCILPDINESKLTILMNGAPGVGKSTITRKLCIEWANGEMLQEYHLVILIQLRDVELCEQSSITKIFPSESLQLSEDVSNYYTSDSENLGKRILFIFDGYDEIQESSQSQKSLLSKLIRGEKLQNCSVLVTSRSYTSNYLKTLSCINCHVEVLGFSHQQIINSIQSSLSCSEKASKLVNLLKERLDIFSLCYIPLNCRIVLFVYEMKNYELPTTLTELYEIFLLHTMKHHLVKCECSQVIKVSIQKANCINKLPKQATELLKSLSEIAYRGIENSMLSFDEELQSTELLSLGLMTAHQNITAICVGQKFQFLHLTVQEFLAAKYLKTLSNDKQLEFLRENMQDKRFRMTLLFLAGLTKLEFLSPSETLAHIEPQLGTRQLKHHKSLKQLTGFIPQSASYSNKTMNELILLAQMLYESQTREHSKLLSFELNKITLSAHSLSPFDALVISNFLSITPISCVWEEIDIVNCSFPIFFVVKHKLQPKKFSIGTTKILKCGPIESNIIPCIINIYQNLKELHLFFVNFNHDSFCMLCKAISDCQNFEILLIINDEKQMPTKITRKKIKLSANLETHMCSQSFIYLMNFLQDKTKSILCPNQKYIVTDCIQCNCKGYDALQSLCEVLVKHRNLKTVDLSYCDLSSDSVASIAGVLTKNKVTNIAEINLCGNSFSSLKDLSGLFGLKLSLAVHNFLLKPQYHARANEEHYISISSYSVSKSKKDQQHRHNIESSNSTFYLRQPRMGNSKLLNQQLTSRTPTYNFDNPQDCGIILRNLFLPDFFPEVVVDIDDFYNVSLSAISLFLSNNHHVTNFRLETNVEIYSTEANQCKDILNLSEVICAHKSLKYFSIPNFKISKSVINISYNTLFANMCTCALYILLDNMCVSVSRVGCLCITIQNLPNVFQDCEKCHKYASKTVEKLCKLIIINDDYMHMCILPYCGLSQEVTKSLVFAAPQSLHYIDLTGNNVGVDTIAEWPALITGSKLTMVYTLIASDGIKLTIIDNDKLYIKFSNVNFYVTNELLNLIKVPLLFKKLVISTPWYDFYLASTIVDSLLTNCPEIVSFTFQTIRVSKGCHELPRIAQSLLSHKSLQMGEFSLNFVSGNMIISRECFQAPNELLCPLSLQKLLLCLNRKTIVKILLFSQQKAFQNCPDCKTLAIEGINALIKALDESENLEVVAITDCFLAADVVELIANKLLSKTKLKSVCLINDEINSLKIKSLTTLWSRSNSLEFLQLNNEGFLFDVENQALSYTNARKFLKPHLLAFFIESLTRVPPSRSKKLYIKDVDLTNNVEFAESVCELLKNGLFLQEFDLTGCIIDKIMFNSIAKGLSVNCSLQVLNLSNCRREGSDNFSKLIEIILKCQCLCTLNLSNFHFNKELMDTLAAGLVINTRLQCLILNSLKGNVSWQIFFESLKQNKTLQKLSIRNNNINCKELAIVQELLRNNDILQIDGL